MKKLSVLMAFLLAAYVLLPSCGLAEEDGAAVETVASVAENAMPDPEPMRGHEVMPVEDTPALLESWPVPIPPAHELRCPPTDVVEEEAPVPTEIPDEAEKEDELPLTEEAGIEYPSIGLEWQLSPDSDHLYVGDEIALKADIGPMDDLRLQWQVAEKPSAELKENEEEWLNVDGATGKSYSFIVESRMQDWRWRLRVTLENDESIFSDEMMLPETIRVRAEDTPEEEDVLPEGKEEEEVKEEDVLPTADINLLAEMYGDEITYGTEVTLVANIINARDNMQLQWQYVVFPDDGVTEITEDSWIDVPDANGTSHRYVMDEDNENWVWRLLITLPEEDNSEASESDGESVDTEDGEEGIGEELATNEGESTTDEGPGFDTGVVEDGPVAVEEED